MRLIVRPPSEAFRRALSEHPDKNAIDPGRALHQHRAVVAALEAVGVEIVALPPDADLPDACFVSDVLITLPRAGDAAGKSALVVATRPGAPSRRPEVASVFARTKELIDLDAAFSTAAHVVEIAEPGTLDGGDVIVYGDRVAIGVSARSNTAGAQQLAEAVRAVGYRAYLCPVIDRLHLATAVTVIDDERLIGTEAGFATLDQAGPDVAPLAEIDRILVPDAELPAANVLAVNGVCIIAAGYAHTVAELTAAGETVVEVDLSEFTRADGGPTCLVAFVH
jgi:dimethylargininase